MTLIIKLNNSNKINQDNKAITKVIIIKTTNSRISNILGNIIRINNLVTTSNNNKIKTSLIKTSKINKIMGSNRINSIINRNNKSKTRISNKTNTNNRVVIINTTNRIITNIKIINKINLVKIKVKMGVIKIIKEDKAKINKTRGKKNSKGLTNVKMENSNVIQRKIIIIKRTTI